MSDLNEIEINDQYNIWEDEEGVLATEPIDNEINSKSTLLQSLSIIMQI